MRICNDPCTRWDRFRGRLSLKISPAYKEAIGWLATVSDPEEAKKKFAERSFYNITQEIQHRGGAFLNFITDGPCSKEYKPPVVVTPPAALPKQPNPALKLPGK